MSGKETAPADVEVVTLSDSPMRKSAPSTPSSGSKGQKMKQMRLPFTPIQRDNALCRQKEEQEKERLKAAEAKKAAEDQKAAEDEKAAKDKKAVEDKKAVKDIKADEEKKVEAEEAAAAGDATPKVAPSVTPNKDKKKVEVESSRKRKHSDCSSNGATPIQRRKSLKECVDDSAVLKVKEANTPTEMIQDKKPIKIKMDFHNKKAASPIVEALKRTPESISNSSPRSLEDNKRAMNVEIAKVKVKIMELKDKLEKAVEKQEFLLAQELKVEITKSEKDQSNLESILQRADGSEMWRVLSANNRKRQSQGSSSASPVLKKKPGTPKNEEEKERIRKEKETERERIKKEKEMKNEQMKKEKEMEKERIKKEKEMEKERMKKEKEMKTEQMKKEKEVEKERLKKEKEMKMEQLKKEKELLKKEKEMEKERAKKEKEMEKERVKKEEQEKRDKLSKSFVSFFVKKTEVNTVPEEESEGKSDIFNQFRIKKDMKLAPVSRRALPDDFTLKLFKDTERPSLFLAEIKTRPILSMGRTWPPETKGEDEVEIIDEDDEDEEMIGQQVEVEAEEAKEKRRAKLLQFCENERPAFFGTWRKTSSRVGPRRPFAKDCEFFDYEYDSDDDWEEEEQGESLSDEEKDKEEDDEEIADEDDDDGFFVGHGVLDKDEAHPEEDSDDDKFDEEMTRMKMKAKEFEEEYKNRKKEVKKLKPRVFGCFWTGSDLINDQLTKILGPNRAIVYGSKPIDTTFSIRKEEKSPPSSEFPNEAVKDLIRLVHQSPNNKKFLIEEFQLFLKNKKMSKEVIKEKIVEIASYSKCLETGPMLNRMCWMVKPDIMSKYNDDLDLSTPWVFDEKNPCKPKTPTPSRADKKPSEQTPATPTSGGTPSTPSTTAASLITKFTKVLTDDERQKQMAKKADKVEKVETASVPEAKLLAKHLVKKRITPTVVNKEKKS